MKKLKLFSKRKAIIIGSLVFFGLAVIYSLLITINTWFNENKFIFQSPVTVTFNKPVQIVKRELLRPQIIEIVNELPEMKDLTPIESYICDDRHWGLLNCRIALAVAKAESNLRADTFNVNTNGSIDIGIFQINSVHYKKPGCSLQDVTDPYKNVDCAYQIWKDSGFHPWSVFKNGSFKEEL